MDEMLKLMDKALVDTIREKFSKDWHEYQEKQIKNIIFQAKSDNKPYYCLNNNGHLSVLVDNVLSCPKFEFKLDSTMRMFVEQGEITAEDLKDFWENITPGKCFSTKCNNQTGNSYCPDCEKDMGVYE